MTLIPYAVSRETFIVSHFRDWLSWNAIGAVRFVLERDIRQSWCTIFRASCTWSLSTTPPLTALFATARWQAARRQTFIRDTAVSHPVFEPTRCTFQRCDEHQFANTLRPSRMKRPETTERVFMANESTSGSQERPGPRVSQFSSNDHVECHLLNTKASSNTKAAV